MKLQILLFAAIFAFSLQSNATIHYRHINKTLTAHGTSFAFVDIDSDGVSECTISASISQADVSWGSNVYIYDSAMNYIVGFYYGQDTSGSVGNWDTYSSGLLSSDNHSNIWFSDKERYLMIKFNISGSQHYGWIRAFSDLIGDSVVIRSVGWNDVAGQGMLPGTGDPSPILDVATISHTKKFDYYISRNVVTINNLNSNEKVSITVYDLMGRTVFSRDIHNGTFPILLNEGLYIVKITDNENNYYTEKVFIQ